MNKDQLLATATAIFVEAIRFNGYDTWDISIDKKRRKIGIDKDIAMELAKQSTHMAIMLHDAVDTAVNDIPKEEQ